ncbi:similar to Saccharomyces cerevisiae YMR213W CEF1 Essential splicing factor [Maudiozyma barnettii]|uniref:Pre-mRNA-splicing factor CEF1 n=1 Tax=Maudiozyma barnettii TaxID=61262 RepID=A0A8H2VCD5_9SACH|nr:Cef1p [Kazachstania barnettii]CAB4252688.1 similar to Saccharomyces cerevisiae YMR213W CEF1 Essential splicing factor [Kazachstania barnettii]CAD1780478.1 similar to Saccharomyces cerevisiae YMR213W CEF1 Essential splicing factor [Kazachstania barnettii]
MAPTPVYVKGGVWTNVEDQILKAAIQKYGTHQWSKIASLLHKKSSRQCEIRWNEFLNPQLNFTGFSKEEDVKLLTLARKLPNQWRTISDMMGRTAQICIERYNILLSDDNVGNEHDEHDDLRLSTSLDFKVGDLNPHADTQVAKPDKDELEDDEREMLAEARARLLNTQGKKGTRRIRERMLEESKRIAELQKRRELKQAGVKLAPKKMKKKYADEIDYNVDIPYEQVPLAGLYDTAQEDKRSLADLRKYEQTVQRKGLHEKIDISDREKSHGKRKNEGKVDESKEPNQKKQLQKKRRDDNLHQFRDGKDKLNLSKPDCTASSLTPSDDRLVVSRRALLDSKNVGAVLTDKNDYTRSRASSIVSVGSTTSQMEASTIKLKKRQLHELLQSLPTPKNDYELVLDISDDEEPTLMNSNVGTPPRDTATTTPVDLNIDSLNIRVLPTPGFIENPISNFDQAYNELVSNSINTTSYRNTQHFADVYNGLHDALQRIVSKNPIENKGPLPENISTQTLKSGIIMKQKEVARLQEALTYINPLSKENHTLSKELSEDKIPELRELQQGYYVNYRLYRNETQATRARLVGLQRALSSLQKQSMPQK